MRPLRLPLLLGPLLLALLAVLLCGCGISVQHSPESIAVRPPDLRLSPTPTSGSAINTVYFVRGTHLQVALRRTTTGDLRDVLRMLSTGPSTDEAHGGLRTALAPQVFSVLQQPDDVGTLVLGVSRQFTSVPGGDQLLAVAQVVWTVTQFPTVMQVRFVDDGHALEVPTDHGLTQQPVDRSDYISVKPRTAGSSPTRGASTSTATSTATPAPTSTSTPAPPT